MRNAPARAPRATTQMLTTSVVFIILDHQDRAKDDKSGAEKRLPGELRAEKEERENEDEGDARAVDRRDSRGGTDLERGEHREPGESPCDTRERDKEEWAAGGEGG